MKINKFYLLCKSIFLAFFSFVFLTRILILTENYTWTLDPVSLEMVYLVTTTLLAVFARGGKIRIIQGSFWFVMLAFLAHTLLWGTVIIDDVFADLITTHFKSQVMFVVIILITTLAVYQLDVKKEFFKCCYYTLAATMIYFFVTNISELDLSNLANIMTANERTRVSFGFGHYNTLGACCVCGMLMWNLVRKGHKAFLTKLLDAVVIAVMVVMLLSCASRSALTSLIVYGLMYYGGRMNEWSLSKRIMSTMKVLRAAVVMILVVWVVLEVDYMELLNMAQRALLFTHALPMFFNAGKVWWGLGYASNVAYATNQTPYLTYWLDNAYIYYLVTTGIIGCAVLIVATIILGRELHKRNKLPFGRETFSAFMVYLYISLFEVALFNSGVIISYIYLPWFLLHISQKRKEDTLEHVQQ